MASASDDAGLERMKKQPSDDSKQGGAAEEDDAGEPVVEYPGWKAMPYIIGAETFEGLGTKGTQSNLLVYLTTVYHMQSVDAATLINFFNGTSNLTPVFGAFLSDTYIGRYTTLAAASISSFIGMAILTLTAALDSLHPPLCNGGGKVCEGASRWQLMVLFGSFFFLIVGSGGIRSCSLAFGADQFNLRTSSGRRGFASFFNWYYFSVTFVMMISSTIIVYLQSNVNWALGLAVPTALMGISCALFFMGTRLYVRVYPEGSPFASFAQVLVAATRKRHLHRPVAAASAGVAPVGLFDPPHQSKFVSKIPYSDQFWWLDKAAVITSDDELGPDRKTPANPWRLCTVQQVEQVKCLARIMPVWLSGNIYLIMIFQLGTYGVLQAMQTDRRIGKSGFQIPAASFIIFDMLTITLWIPVYDRVVVPAVRRVTRREGGFTQLQRIGIGLALSVAMMLVAAAVERRRRKDGNNMSCFWLVPQLVLAGLSESFAAIGQNDLFYKHIPENMRSAVGAISNVGFSLASYASGFMVMAVHRATGGEDGKSDWLAQDLNQGHLDLFYLLVAALGAVNLVYFVFCARWYRFKKADANTGDDDGYMQLHGSDDLEVNASPA